MKTTIPLLLLFFSIICAHLNANEYIVLHIGNICERQDKSTWQSLKTGDILDEQSHIRANGEQAILTVQKKGSNEIFKLYVGRSVFDLKKLKDTAQETENQKDKHTIGSFRKFILKKSAATEIQRISKPFMVKRGQANTPDYSNEIAWIIGSPDKCIQRTISSEILISSIRSSESILDITNLSETDSYIHVLGKISGEGETARFIECLEDNIILIPSMTSLSITLDVASLPKGHPYIIIASDKEFTPHRLFLKLTGLDAIKSPTEKIHIGYTTCYTE